MKRITIKNLTGIMLFCMMLCACGGTEGIDINMIPVADEDLTPIYINKKGETVLKAENGTYSYFSDGLTLTRQDGLYGFIDKKGKQVIEMQYKDALPFSEGVTWVVKENGFPELIDKKGKVKFTLEQAESVEAFHDGLAVFTITGDDGKTKYGCINKSGKIVIEPQDNEITSFYNGKAIIENTDYKKGYMDKSGKIVINCQFDKAADFGDNGLACVQFGDKWGVINTKGEYVINPQFERMFADGDWFIIMVDGKLGWCDKNGKYVINPQFSNVWNFAKNDLAPVSNDYKTWGYINKKGVYTINPQFEYATPFFNNDVALVSLNKKKGLVDKTGKYVVNPQYDEVGTSLIEYVASGKSTHSSQLYNDFFDVEGITSQIKNMITEDAIDGTSFDASIKTISEKYQLNRNDFSRNSKSTKLKGGKFSGDTKYVLNMVGNPLVAARQGWSTNYEIDANYIPESYSIVIDLDWRRTGRAVELMKVLFREFFGGEELNETLLYPGKTFCNYGYPECRLWYNKDQITLNVKKGKITKADTSILSESNTGELKIKISDNNPCDGGNFVLTIAGGNPFPDKEKPFKVESKHISGSEGKIFVGRFFTDKEGIYSVEVTTSSNDESAQELIVTDSKDAKATTKFTIYNCP